MYCTTDCSFPSPLESPSYPPFPAQLVFYKVPSSSAVLLSQQLACLSLLPLSLSPSGSWLAE